MRINVEELFYSLANSYNLSIISQVNRRISPVIQFSYLHFCLESLTGFGDGGGGDPQQDCLLGYGEFQVREDIGADIAFCEVGMRFPERFRGKVEGIPEHPFQFGPLFILDIAGKGTCRGRGP